MARFRPAIVWNDITYPNGANVLALFSDNYNAIPDGVVNDRFTIIPGITETDADLASADDPVRERPTFGVWFASEPVDPQAVPVAGEDAVAVG
jgi:hypothetical protein